MLFRELTTIVAAGLMIAACGNNRATNDTATTEVAVVSPQPTVIVEEPMGDSTKADYIVISKQTMTLRLYDSDKALICCFPVATGKNDGNKERPGDMKTPEGEFTVEEVVPAAHWTHDFGDGKGVIEGCYGNWFIRLKTPPHRGIGIHGTHDPASIGTRATEGCIRLHNNDLDSLKPMVHVGMRVTITAGDADLRADGITTSSEMTPAEPKPVETRSPEVAATPSTEAHDSAKVDEDDNVVWHTVADGDLVGRIARQYGTTTAEIRRLNPDIDIDRIFIGQRIKVSDGATTTPTSPEATPTTATPAPSAATGDEVWYTVEDGDLVGRIAQRHGTTSAKIAELNPDINIDRISIGQRIRVK